LQPEMSTREKWGKHAEKSVRQSVRSFPLSLRGGKIGTNAEPPVPKAELARQEREKITVGGTRPVMLRGGKTGQEFNL